MWTKENHLRTKQYYRFYHYDPDKKSVVRERDWLAGGRHRLTLR